jgi:hypothetical protein
MKNQGAKYAALNLFETVGRRTEEIVDQMSAARMKSQARRHIETEFAYSALRNGTRFGLKVAGRRGTDGTKQHETRCK